VLVLCPSLTIEKGLTEKFEDLVSNPELRNAIPEESKNILPRIINANSTIIEGDICIENIHAVYESTGSSIKDSFKNGGEDTLVLNDESHHIFNKTNEKEMLSIFLYLFRLFY
ncbi:DEAD/DEAH box helicase family protein, partial [Streptococcus pyogenes]